MDSSTTPSTKKVDVYQIVTDRIISLLEAGTVPWQKPWTDAGMPMNALSKRPYRGINFWLLLSLDYEHNLFLTWDQIKKLGGSVKQGEHGHVVVYWKTQSKAEVDDEKGEKKPPLLRYYKVFNLHQCRDLPEELMTQVPVPREHQSILACERVITDMPVPPELRCNEPSAYYHIAEDYINMPKREVFTTAEGYYATLFHELVHSTGHEKRLNRSTITQMAEFGSDMYSQEELVAELGSAFLSSHTGILESQIAPSASYINGWLGKLKGDKKFIVQAAGMAQKAVDLIIQHSTPDAEEVPEISDTTTVQ
jgi:antirestriction protein ArdC